MSILKYTFLNNKKLGQLRSQHYMFVPSNEKEEESVISIHKKLSLYAIFVSTILFQILYVLYTVQW